MNFEKEKAKIEKALKEMKCCICGEPITEMFGNHNPYPVRPECRDFFSKDGRCCSKCNDTYVASFRRMVFTDDKLYDQLAEMLADCKNLDEIHDFAEANDFPIRDFSIRKYVNIADLEKDGEIDEEAFSKAFDENQSELPIVPRPTKK